MKKLFFILGFLLMAGMVFAEGEHRVVVGKPNITGLENAISRVRNNETAQHLTEVWNNIQARINDSEAKKISGMNISEVSEQEGRVVLKGKREAKFLGIIKMDRTESFEVDAQGVVTRQKKFLDILWNLGEA